MGQKYGYGGQDLETRVTLNLEDVVLHEQKLEAILEVSFLTLTFLQNLRNDLNCSMACEDWWDLTETTDIYRTIWQRLVRDIQFR